jgi:hypothetical protein
MMKVLHCVIAALFMVGCSVTVPVDDLKPAPKQPEDQPAPLGASAVPPAVDVEKFLPPAPEPVPCTPDMTDFEGEPTPFPTEHRVKYMRPDGGWTEWVLRPGVLISECEAVRSVNLKTKAKRLQIELDAFKALRVKEFELWRLAERNYQLRIVGLENELKDAQKVSFWDEWKFEIGIGLGIAVSAALVVGSVEIIQAVGQ